MTSPSRRSARPDFSALVPKDRSIVAVEGSGTFASANVAFEGSAGGLQKRPVQEGGRYFRPDTAIVVWNASVNRWHSPYARQAVTEDLLLKTLFASLFLMSFIANSH